jgi:ABC-type dipeptide/oligopeptide/nickel transport system permease subunit
MNEKNFYRIFFKNNLIKIGFIVVIVIFIISIFAPILSRYKPLEISGSSLLQPDGKHPFGTDDVGHDLYSQFLYGARSSLRVGITVGLCATAIALLVGGLAGYRGGAVEQVVMRIVDIFLCIPRFPVLIVMAHFLGASINNIIMFLILFSWPAGTRLVRSRVLSLKASPVVESEILFGARGRYIFFRHVLPDLIPLLIVLFVLDASHAVLAEAGLSFLGLGDPATVSWGIMLHYAFIFPGLFLGRAWLWWVIPPGAGITALVLGFMFISSGLEKHFCPLTEKRSTIVELFLNYA